MTESPNISKWNLHKRIYNLHQKGAQEFITVFAGQVRISTETESFELTAGDSLRFCADQAHGYDNIGNGDVQMSKIIFYDKPQ